MTITPVDLNLTLDYLNRARLLAEGDSPGGPAIEQLTSFAAVAALIALPSRSTNWPEPPQDQTTNIGSHFEALKTHLAD